MVRRDVKRFEVMIIIFDFRPFFDLITNAGEESFNPGNGLRNGVQTTFVGRSTGKCYVNRFFSQSDIDSILLNTLTTLVNQLLQLFFCLIDFCPGLGSFLFR